MHEEYKDFSNVLFQIEAYEAVISWVKSNVTENRQYLPILFSRLRLSQLPVSYLVERVCTEDIVRQDTACRDYIDEAKHYQMSLAQLVANVPVSDRILPRKSYAGLRNFCFYDVCFAACVTCKMLNGLITLWTDDSIAAPFCAASCG